MPPPPPPGTAVLVPVKAFHLAKVRLAPALAGEARAQLARRMGEGVLAAAGPLPTAVVCDDPAVARWAETKGARVLWTPGLGLNGAVSEGVRRLAAAGAGRVIVAHADLPLARDLTWLAGGEPAAGGRPGRYPGFGPVTLVPDRHHDGTNVLAVPAAAGFRFCYGARSFSRHRAEAERLGLAVRVVEDPSLGWDVDLPDDLRLPDGSDLAATPTTGGPSCR